MALLPKVASDGSLRTTPWQRREDGGVYVGHDRSVWLYRQLPLAPLKHEDPVRRLQVGGSLESILEEVGSRSKDVGQGIRSLAQNRQVHIVAISYNVPNTPPRSSGPLLDDFLDDVLQPYTNAKALLIGVKLRSSAIAQAAKARGVGAKVKAALTAGTESVEGNLDAFAADFEDIDTILRRGGGTVPTADALAQLECWWNFGQTPDVTIEYDVAAFDVAGAGTYEIRAVSDMPVSMNAPYSQWLLDAMTHQNPATAISIRAELEPHTVTRSRLRKQRRRLIAAEEEEAATGDLGREENSSRLTLAEDVESMVVASRTPWLAGTSILLAKRVENEDDDYADFLAAAYQIKTVPLVERQLEGLDEFQPTSTARATPFPQDMNPAMVAYAGLASYSNLGDDTGALLGHVDPDNVPCYVNPYAASRMNTPPVFGIFGDPGSGKTFCAQSVAGQSALNGDTVFFVNPKPMDSLAPWAHWVADQGAASRVVSMSKMGDGAFDPFGYCSDPQTAAEVLTRHIQTVLGKALEPRDEWTLSEGLSRGAASGARCAWEALAYVQDKRIVDLVTAAATSNSLVALAFSRTPARRWGAGGGLTLIEFDRELALPKAGKFDLDMQERVAVAAMRLVSRASLEMLLAANGGVLVIDEAHHYIGSPEGLASMDKLAREGRSMGILPIFITQRPSDLLQVDMEGFMSRVLCMKLKDASEATAALKLCLLEPTQQRIDFLRDAGPRAGSEGVPGRPALGILRDLRDQHAVVTIGPFPEELRLAMSTNRTDRELRAAIEQDGSTNSTQEVAR